MQCRERARAGVVLVLGLSGCVLEIDNRPILESRVVNAGPTCANGGHEIMTGVDSDQSGALSGQEISGRTTVCYPGVDANAVAGRGLTGGASPDGMMLEVDFASFGSCPEGQFAVGFTADGALRCTPVVSNITDSGFTMANLGEGAVDLALDFTRVQRRVSGGCPEGSGIRTVAEDGSVTCRRPAILSCQLSQGLEFENDRGTGPGAGRRVIRYNGGVALPFTACINPDNLPVSGIEAGNEVFRFSPPRAGLFKFDVSLNIEIEQDNLHLLSVILSKSTLNPTNFCDGERFASAANLSLRSNSVSLTAVADLETSDTVVVCVVGEYLGPAGMRQGAVLFAANPFTTTQHLTVQELGIDP